MLWEAIRKMTKYAVIAAIEYLQAITDRQSPAREPALDARYY